MSLENHFQKEHMRSEEAHEMEIPSREKLRAVDCVASESACLEAYGCVP